MRTIRYHPKVPAGVREILAYYEGISAALADEFWSELGEALRYAQDHPKRHHFDPSGRRRSNLRIFPYHFLFPKHQPSSCPAAGETGEQSLAILPVIP